MPCVETENTALIFAGDKGLIAIMMRRLVAIAILTILLGALVPLAVHSECSDREMTITPGDVLVVSTPATFSIAFDCSDPANFPNILLIMTRTSYESLTGPIIVNWTGGSTSFVKANFQAVDSGYIPPPMTTSFDSGRYTLAELRKDLGINDTINDVIYYVFGFFLSGAVGRTAQVFEVALPSGNPRMLVLALARTFGSTSFNIRTFLPLETIPEFGPILPVLMLTCTLILIDVYIVTRFRARVS